MTNEIRLFLEACKAEKIMNSATIVYLFTPKKAKIANLIKTGLFDGSESFMRLTVTKDSYGDFCENNYTVFHNDGRSCHWHSGTSGYTCVSESVKETGRLIYNAVVEKFGKIPKK